MRVVISLGGAVLIPEQDRFDVDFLKKFKKLILKFKDKHKFVIVCGGGKICRTYVSAAQELGLRDPDVHVIGRDVTLVNAKLVASFFGEKAKYIHGSPEYIADMFDGKKILITGGYRPGWNTDVGSAYIAEHIKAKLLVNLTNIDHIYTKDPRKHDDAKPLQTLTWEQFEKILGDKFSPGANMPFHPLAAKVCNRIGLKMVFLKGLNNLEKALNDKQFIGTVVF